MKIFHLLLCALGMLALSTRADAATLYAATAAGNAGQLYIIDQANGAVLQTVGALNDVTGTNYPITGLAFHPTTGVLYGSTGNNPTATGALLVTINPATALVTVIGPYNAGPVNSSGNPTTMADLSFDAAGNLYGVASIGGPNLYSINPATGQATLVGPNGVSTSTSGGGLAISAAGVFYGTPTSSRYGTYDSVTGAFTNIANPVKPVGGAYAALAIDGGFLYGLNLGPGPLLQTRLVKISPIGVVTDVGDSAEAIDAIAFQPNIIPEPTSFALLCLGLPPFVGRRRR